MHSIQPTKITFLLFALSCGLHQVGAQAQSVPPGTVAGKVLCSDSQTPCRFATVTIQTAPPDPNPGMKEQPTHFHTYSAATDINGAFEITGVVPGDYFILAREPGYLCAYDTLKSGHEGEADPSIATLKKSLMRVTVAAGQVSNAMLTLTRGSALGGTVRYDDGGPAINLPVSLFRKDSRGEWKPFSNSAGDNSLAPLGLAPHTDDQGRFYQPSLPPGMYKVMVTLPEAIPLLSTITGPQSLNVVVTTSNALEVFNGGKFRLREAPPIELQEGDERTDLDLTIPTSGLRRLRGFVIGQIDQQPIQGGTVRLLDPVDKSVLRTTSIENDGSFAFEYVPDGSYVIDITGEAKTKISQRYAPFESPLIVASDLPDLNYALKLATR